MDEFIRTQGTSGVVLQAYKDIISLASAWEGKDGKVMLRWSKDQTGHDEYAPKATPTKVILGTQEIATATLLMILKQVTGREYAVKG